MKTNPFELECYGRTEALRDARSPTKFALLFAVISCSPFEHFDLNYHWVKRTRNMYFLNDHEAEPWFIRMYLKKRSGVSESGVSETEVQ